MPGIKRFCFVTVALAPLTYASRVLSKSRVPYPAAPIRDYDSVHLHVSTRAPS